MDAPEKVLSDDELEAAYHAGMARYWKDHLAERDHHAAQLAGLRAVAYAVQRLGHSAPSNTTQEDGENSPKPT